MEETETTVLCEICGGELHPDYDVALERSALVRAGELQPLCIGPVCQRYARPRVGVVGQHKSVFLVVSSEEAEGHNYDSKCNLWQF